MHEPNLEPLSKITENLLADMGKDTIFQIDVIVEDELGCVRNVKRSPKRTIKTLLCLLLIEGVVPLDQVKTIEEFGPAGYFEIIKH